MFAKHIEQGKLICILTFHKRYITFPSEKFRPETWPGKPVGKATPVRQLTSSHRSSTMQNVIGPIRISH